MTPSTRDGYEMDSAVQRRLGQNVDEAPNEVVVLTQSKDQDALELARTGKKPVLQRNFGLVSMTGFSCVLMCTWEGLLTGFVLGYDNGGSAGLIYGMFFNWIGVLSAFSVLGELSSMLPTAGGQYHWVSVLAPERSRRFFSYITGWLTVSGWIAAVATTSFFVATLIVATIQQDHPEYDTQPWHLTLIFWAILLLALVVNSLASKALPVLEVVVLIIHILGFFAIIIPLVYFSSHVSAHDVFTKFNNAGGWSTQTLSFFIGLQASALAFIGSDGAIHMSEEVRNATRDVPRAMIVSIFINGALAVGILLALLFCTNPDDVSSDDLYPFIPILASTLTSNAGATILTSLVTLLQLCASIGSLAAASRMLWAFARDRGVPGWQRISRVNTRTTIPYLSLGICVSIAALVGFINLGSTTAFNDVISILLAGLYSSYFIASALLLYRRVRGDICERTEHDWYEGRSENGMTDAATSSIRQPVITWGPWRIPGVWGIINNVISCAYLLIIIFFSMWPPSTPTTAESMNYSQTAWGGVIILSTVYYLVSAKKYYIGPVIEVEVSRSV